MVVEQDPESGWYVGEIVELPGCYSQAPDVNALTRTTGEAIAAYLQTAAPEDPLPRDVGTMQLDVSRDVPA
jgi:predicted RNase H-like HicB family nuclease